MTRKLALIAAAALMAASARAATVVPGAPASGGGSATVQPAQYRAYPAHRHRRHHGYAWREPSIWRYQRSFRSNATDFYGAREFRGP